MAAPVSPLSADISRTPCLNRLIPLPAPRRIDSKLEWWQLILLSALPLVKVLLILSFLSDAKRGDLKSFVDHKFLNQSTSVRDGSSQQIVANWLAYAKALEAKNFDDAALYLENCLTASSAAEKELRESLILEAARFQALHRNRPDLARQWQD
jgi:hypothetical protein